MSTFGPRNDEWHDGPDTDEDEPTATPKKRVIVQSAPPGRAHWVDKCMATVKEWAHDNGYYYIFLGDELFAELPYEFRVFNNVIKSDYARLQFLERCLTSGYEEAVWIDSDICIWDARFEIPVAGKGEVVCSREVWEDDTRTGIHVLATNNSILGFSRAEDVRVLLRSSRMLLWMQMFNPKRAINTVIGTQQFSQVFFPLRRVVIKSNACFSSTAIEIIAAHGNIGTIKTVCPYMNKLSLLHGATIRAANLASSRKLHPWTMEAVVGTLMNMPHQELGWYVVFTPFHRAYHKTVHFINRVRCWVLRRLAEARMVRS